MQSEFLGIKFTDADVVKDDFIPQGEYNPHKIRPWLLHNEHGHCFCVVFASHLQDALDVAVDNDKLDNLQIHPELDSSRDDYMTSDLGEIASGRDPDCPEYVSPEGVKYWWKDGREPAFLGNASEPFDIDSLGAIEMPNPPFSFVALFNATKEKA